MRVASPHPHRLAAVALVLLAISTAPAPAAEEPLYLNLVWHQHQPLYYKDATGVYTRPWARVHATKDYYDMAAMLAQYPKVRVTFNLTPVLIRQLDDLAAGAKDLYWVMAEQPASQVSEAGRIFLLERFFDANWSHVIGRFPRYQELLDKRGGSSIDAITGAAARFTEQDIRDLQVWFNLAWFDPDFLAQSPLKELVEKGRDFAEADKKIVFDKAREVVRQVIAVHKKLQDAGQIEVITTPYAHPILPLLYNSDLAAKGDPSAKLPTRFSWPQDAIAQVKKAVEVYQEHFGKKPVGMWPAEGAVGQDIVKMVADNGFRWMASGEQVLAKSLGKTGFARDSQDVVTDADALYRPYYVRYGDGPRVAVFFRDLRLSDLIGFEYSGTPGEKAAEDFMARLEAIRTRLASSWATGPHIASVILDGENAWENYDNDGKEFLGALYRKLSESETIRTVTPSEYLAKFPEQRSIDTLWWGCWFTPDYSTWIGESEEDLAWEYLGKTRKALGQYDLYKKKTTTPEKLAKALDAMYLAEGSDWFWWYGDDQDSGNDQYFDEGFRALLKQVYLALDEPVPDLLSVPIIEPKPVAGAKGIDGPVTPTIDGTAKPGEWDKAGSFTRPGGVMARGSDYLRALYLGLDPGNLYLRVDTPEDFRAAGKDTTLQLYFSFPNQENWTSLTSRKGVLALRAGFVLSFTPTGSGVTASLARRNSYDEWEALSPAGFSAAAGANAIEAAIPLAALGELQPGDAIRLQAVVSRGDRDLVFLPDGPTLFLVPDLGTTKPVLAVQDPTGDDHGPGSYVYPTDPVFEPGVFDITRFSVSYNDANLVLQFTVRGPIANPWNSGIGLSVQTFDIYIDRDPGAGTGARKLLEGRNASLAKGYGWEYAVWVEGWSQKLLVPGADGKPAELPGTPVKVVVNATAREVTILVSRKALADLDPAKASYAAMVLSQEGYPAPGVRRVREVLAKAEQWRVGGGPADTNHTRIMDLAWPTGASPTQEELLSKYPPSQEASMDALGPDDFAQLPMLAP